VPNHPHDHVASPAEWTAEREAILDQRVKAGKLVLTSEESRLPEAETPHHQSPRVSKEDRKNGQESSRPEFDRGCADDLVVGRLDECVRQAVKAYTDASPAD